MNGFKPKPLPNCLSPMYQCDGSSIKTEVVQNAPEVASINVSTSITQPVDRISSTTPGGCFKPDDTETETDEKPVLFYLFLLLLLVPVAIATYMCIKKRKKHREKDRDAELAFQRFQRKHFQHGTRKGRRIQIEVSPPSDDDNDHQRRPFGRRRVHTTPSGDYDLITNRDQDFHVYRVMKNAKNYHRCSEVSAGSVFLNDTSLGTPTCMCQQSKRRSSHPSSVGGSHLLMVPSCGPGGSSRCASYLTLHSAQEPDPPIMDIPHSQNRRQTHSSCGDRDYHHSGRTSRVPHLYLHNSQKPSHYGSLPHPQLLKDGLSPAPLYNDYGRYSGSPTKSRGRPEKIAKSLPFLYDFALNGKCYAQKDPTYRKDSWQTAKGTGHSQQYGNEFSNGSWFPSESDIAEYCTAHEDTLMNCTDNTVFEQGPNTSEGKPPNFRMYSSSQTPANPTGRHTVTPQTVKVQNFSVSRVYTEDDTGSKKALFTSMYNKKQSLLSIECDSESALNVVSQDGDSHDSSSHRQMDSISASQSLLVDNGGKQPCLVADYENTTFETSMVEVVPRLSLPPQENIGDFHVTENKMADALIDPNNNLQAKPCLFLQKEQNSVCSDNFVLEEGESMV
ncbi:uncharacterized protein LOC132563981 [Ylistrum balloti]|uniref:uncharacterized protein LOC132563981 n=1 Tax=Ylistrum balloti TaxID=509963 RepID=UPI002905CCF9|nr:uncharacterized protein LOC132563981 [Ylistrum balloti]